MKLYEIVVKSEFDDTFCKTILVMSCNPITKDTEGVKVMAKLDEDWWEYIDSVHEKKVLIAASNDEELSDIAGVLYSFGQ